MAFIHGSKANVYLNGYDLTLFFRSANIGRTADMAESSAFQTGAKSYVAGMNDATCSMEGLYDGSAAAIDERLEAILAATTKPILNVGLGVEAVGTVAHAMECDESSLDVEASTDDVAMITTEFQSSSGAERLLVHKPLTVITTANDGNGTAIDNGAATTAGGVGYLHVTAASGGGTLTVKVQHSVDDAVYADLITFTPSTAIGAERVVVTGTVNRYTRASDAIDTGSQTYVMAFGRKTF
jgi:hypothetical protein